MADQTPRVPELWWSPEGCSVYVDREGAAPHYIRMQDTALHALPADAVRLVPEAAVETEWGWRPDPVDEPRAVISASDEQAARERASKARGRDAVRREVGLWTVVES